MRAATLFEVLIVIVIFSLLVIVSFPYSLQLINQTKVDSAAKQISYEIFHQQQAAYSGQAGKNYGVAFYSDHIVSYVGSSLASAESTFNIPLESPITITSITLSSGNEVNFATGSLTSPITGYVKISDYSKIFIVNLNAEGMISYDAQ
jgi:Tfp pilus assembly protein FimT